MKNLNKKTLISGSAIIIYFLFMYILECKFTNKIITEISTILLFSSIVITIFLVLKEYIKNKKINYKILIISMLLIGIIVRTLYISYTDIYDRQHDVAGRRGHLAYIETVYKTGELPQHNKWQFYHQPLHYLISASWLKINDYFEVDLRQSREGIQYLTAVYSSMIMLITYCILKELKIKDKYKLLVLMIMAIHPTFIILSGSINNDILMIMFTFFAILYLIKWNKKSNYKNTIILALFTACIALSKISGTIIAIPIIYIFISKFIKDFKKGPKNKKLIEYLLKFTLFGIISLGLGLSFSIRNFVMFDQEIFYVPEPGKRVYCGDNTWFDRLNIFSNEMIENTYCNPREDCNIPTYIIKCSLFGEFNINNLSQNNILPRTLTVINCLLIIISLISFVKIIITHRTLKRRVKVYINLLGWIFFGQIFVYAYSNILMPYGCTMDFRYIVPTIFTGMMFIIINLMRFDKNKQYLWKHKIIYGIVVIFLICSIIFEITDMRLLI